MSDMLHVKSGIPKPRFLTETQFAFRASSRMSGLPLPLSRMHQNQTASVVAGAGAKLFMSGDKGLVKKKKTYSFPGHFTCQLYQLLTAVKLTHYLVTVLNDCIFVFTSTPNTQAVFALHIVVRHIFSSVKTSYVM
jgi:hypothetical protein